MYLIPENDDKFRIIVVDDSGQERSLTNTAVDGKSAYEIAIEHGYVGTESQWLDSLHGSNGISTTVAVGTVTTLLPNQQVTVTNSGTSLNAILNFGIPKGDTGDISVINFEINNNMHLMMQLETNSNLDFAISNNGHLILNN